MKTVVTHFWRKSPSGDVAWIEFLACHVGGIETVPFPLERRQAEDLIERWNQQGKTYSKVYWSYGLD